MGYGTSAHHIRGVFKIRTNRKLSPAFDERKQVKGSGSESYNVTNNVAYRGRFHQEVSRNISKARTPTSEKRLIIVSIYGNIILSREG